MRARANAWAIGDLEAIFKVSVADREGACRAAMFDNPVMKAQPGLQSVQARLRAVWLATATKALDAHAATFAVLPAQGSAGSARRAGAAAGQRLSGRAPE
jgi:hypothetical protein